MIDIKIRMIRIFDDMIVNIINIIKFTIYEQYWYSTNNTNIDNME